MRNAGLPRQTPSNAIETAEVPPFTAYAARPLVRQAQNHKIRERRLTDFDTPS